MKTSKRTMRLLIVLLVFGAAQGMLFSQTGSPMNSIGAQAERSAHLLGSYLSAIADPRADATTVQDYKTKAKDMFSSDATVEISSKNRKPILTLSAQEYIDRHYETLVAAKGYAKIALQWEVLPSSTTPVGDKVQCTISQTFAGINAKGDTLYEDFTVKSLMIEFETRSVRVKGAAPVKMLKIKAIKVIHTGDPEKRKSYVMRQNG